MTRCHVTLLVLSLLITGPATAQDRVPQIIKIQGYLTDATGAPIDDTVTMVFDLYDAPVGGTLINSTGPVSVPVNKGVYDAELNFTAADFSRKDRFLEHTVDGEVLSPRSRLASTPYAYRSETGLSCWDLNNDDICDPATEDLTGDLACDALDCHGLPGPQGDPGLPGSQGEPGLNCWDLNGNADCDLTSEDLNEDLQCSAADCQASRVDASDYGAHPTATGSTNSSAIQQAINAAHAAGGGEVWIATPGTYDLDQQGPDPTWGGYRHCLQLKSNVALRIVRGVTLRLANNQQVSLPVNMIVFGNVSNVFIGGGGRITGNTAGQSGWSGGYAQITNGLIISGRDSDTPGSSNIRIADLTLDDHFSNPINIDGKGGRASNVSIERVTIRAVGEGPQVISADDVFLRDINVNDTADVAVGDGVELSYVSRFILDGVVVTDNGAGSAVDIYGCKDGVVSNVVVDGWNGGITVQSSSFPVFTPNPANITVTNAVVRNIGVGAGGLELRGADATGILFSGIIVDNSASGGAQIPTGTTPVSGPVVIQNSQFNNNDGAGILVRNIRDLTISGVTVNGNGTDGIYLLEEPGVTNNDQLSGIRLSDITARGNGSCGIKVTNAGHPYHYTGALVNALVEDNAVCGVVVEGTDTRKNFAVRNVSPDETSGGNGSFVTGMKYLRPTSDQSVIYGGTKGQELYLLFEGAHTIVSGTGASQLQLSGGADFAGTDNDILLLRYDNADDNWKEVSRSVN